MFHFIMGLRSEFEPICAQLLCRSTLPTMVEALNAVIAEETRLRTIYAPSVPQHSILNNDNIEDDNNKADDDFVSSPALKRLRKAVFSMVIGTIKLQRWMKTYLALTVR